MRPQNSTNVSPSGASGDPSGSAWSTTAPGAANSGTTPTPASVTPVIAARNSCASAAVDSPATTIAAVIMYATSARGGLLLGQLQQLGHAGFDAATEYADVVGGVVVAGDAVVEHAVIGEDGDADPQLARQRHEGERLEHRPPA